MNDESQTILIRKQQQDVGTLHLFHGLYPSQIELWEDFLQKTRRGWCCLSQAMKILRFPSLEAEFVPFEQTALVTFPLEN